MKKIFLFALPLSLIFAVVAPLVPHSHGDDADHSTHADCPLFRLQQAPVLATEPMADQDDPLLVFARVPVSENFLYRVHHSFHLSLLRAPPVLL